MAGPIVQSLWVGRRLSTMERLAIRSFLVHGHEFHLYCYDEIEGVPHGTTVKDASAILPREQVFAYRSGFGKGSFSGGSNFFRYKLLLERGGWWVDADVVCLRPFDFTTDYVIASEHDDRVEGAVLAATNVIKQPAGSPLMRWMWRICRQKSPDQIQWDEIGPRLLNESAVKLGYDEYVCAPSTFNPVPCFEFRGLFDPGRTFSFGSNVFAVHLWHQMWREYGPDPNGPFPESCLYAQLRRQYLAD